MCMSVNIHMHMHSIIGIAVNFSVFLRSLSTVRQAVSECTVERHIKSLSYGC